MSQFSTQLQPYLPRIDFDLRTRVEQLDHLVNFLVNRLDEATNKISQTEKNNFEWFQSITECHRHFKEELTNIRVSQTLMERELKTVMARINENFINSDVSQILLERGLKTVVTQNKSLTNDFIKLNQDFENLKTSTSPSVENSKISRKPFRTNNNQSPESSSDSDFFELNQLSFEHTAQNSSISDQSDVSKSCVKIPLLYHDPLPPLYVKPKRKKRKVKSSEAHKKKTPENSARYSSKNSAQKKIAISIENLNKNSAPENKIAASNPSSFDLKHLSSNFHDDTSKKNTTSNSSMKPQKISFEISQNSLETPIEITPETLFENFTDVEKSYFDPLKKANKKILERSSTSNFHNQGSSAQPQNNDSKFSYGYPRYSSDKFQDETAETTQINLPPPDPRLFT